MWCCLSVFVVVNVFVVCGCLLSFVVVVCCCLSLFVVCVFDVCWMPLVAVLLYVVVGCSCLLFVRCLWFVVCCSR